MSNDQRCSKYIRPNGNNINIWKEAAATHTVSSELLASCHYYQASISTLQTTALRHLHSTHAVFFSTPKLNSHLHIMRIKLLCSKIYRQDPTLYSIYVCTKSSILPQLICLFQHYTEYAGNV